MSKKKYQSSGRRLKRSGFNPDEDNARDTQELAEYEKSRSEKIALAIPVVLFVIIIIVVVAKYIL